MQFRTITLLLAAGLLSQSAWSQGAHDHDHSPGSNKIRIIENKGQWGTTAKYRAEVNSGSIYLTDAGFVYHFTSSEDLAKVDKAYHDEQFKGDINDMVIRNHAYKVNFVNANANIAYVPADQGTAKFNYFIGNDPTKWGTNASVYGNVTQKNVYNGVDVKVYSQNGGMKYDLIVAPNTNPNIIKLGFEGVNPVLNEEGDLIVKTSVNEVIEKAPYTYQIVNGQEVEVASRYKIVDNQLTFEFPNGFNSNLPLVIDPNLIFVNFSGATSGTYYAHSTGYDFSGNTLTAALAYSAGWPTTVGAFNTTFGGGNMAAMHKYSNNGSALIFGSFIGGTTGSGNMVPNTVRADRQGNIYFAGSTTNASLPVITGGYQATLGGAADLYIGKLDPTGTNLLASTYLGGTASEGSRMNTTTAYTGNTDQGNPITPTDMAVDGDGNVWVASNSGSANFPTTAGAVQSTLAGSHDAILSKFDPNLQTLMYSTFYGGTAWDGATSIEYDESRNYVGISGYTGSTNFPTTAGVYNATAPGGVDGFLGLFDVTNGATIAATYIGTSSTDIAIRIAFDCASNVYTAGRTQGAYPITATGTHVVPNGYIFIDKLTPTLTASVASTRTGSTNTSIVPSAMMVDVCGNILIGTIVNNTSQPNMPLTPNAFETNPRAFYFAAYGANFNDLVFGSYFGSNNNLDHFHPGICRIDPNGIIYHSVCSPTSGAAWSANFTAHAVHPNKLNGSTNDNVTFKFDFQAFSASVQGETPEGGNMAQNHAIRGCRSAFLHYSRNNPDTTDMVLKLQILGDAINGVDYEYIDSTITIPANLTNATLEIKALLAPAATGIRKVVINTLAPCACDGNEDNIMSSDTIYIIDSVYVAILSPTDTSCPGDLISITANIDSTLGYSWAPTNLITNQNGLTIEANPSVTTTYEITAWQKDAPSTCPQRKAAYRAFVEPYPVIDIPNNFLTYCYKDSISMTMLVTPDNPGYIYEWGPAQYFSNPNIQTTKFLAPIGMHTLYLTATTPGAGCSSTDSLIVNMVPPLDIVGINPADTLINIGDKIHLTVDDSSHGVLWSWQPTEHLNDAVFKTVEAGPEETTVYNVIVWDKYGCTDTASAIVRVGFTPRMFIPNAFSPNGDGLNDEFKIDNLTYEKLVAFRVFDRLGKCVFETLDPNKGWNGTNKNGKELASDVYFYHIIINGPTKDTETMEFKGDVTLIR